MKMKKILRIKRTSLREVVNVISALMILMKMKSIYHHALSVTRLIQNVSKSSMPFLILTTRLPGKRVEGIVWKN